MISGTGIDLVELERIRPLIHNQKFIARILSPLEREAFAQLSHPRRQEEYLAGRFAAKEAYAKALGTGIGAQLSWQDISVINNNAGQPILTHKNKPTQRVHLSITHTKKYAAAFVIIEGLSG
ncbi:MAG: holo-ACP synthase [Tuberibacillus sp.]